MLMQKKLRIWQIFTIVFGLLFIASIFTGNFGLALNSNAVAENAINYINTVLLQGQATAKLVSMKSENGLYNLKIDINGKEITTYLSKDGSLLFPSVINIKEEVQPTQQTEKKVTCDNIKKTDKPIMDAFIVSNCPYGLQMQRALAPVAELLKDNIKVRYLGSIENRNVTSMHGDKEATENLRQICIREEQSDKYWSYTSCYIKDGNSDSCLASVQIDKDKLNDCMASDKGLEYAKEDFDLSEKFSVSSSPTLILDNVKVSEYDFGGRSADALKTLLCCAFETQPESCKTQLDTVQANTSFSQSYSSSSSPTAQAASCG